MKQDHHLYGYGEYPPFRWYIDYLGKPLYKGARKLGLPSTIALAAANIPGSAAHALIGQTLEQRAAIFLVSEIIFTLLFYKVHQGYQKERKIDQAARKNSPTIEDILET